LNVLLCVIVVYIVSVCARFIFRRILREKWMFKKIAFRRLLNMNNQTNSNDCLTSITTKITTSKLNHLKHHQNVSDDEIDPIILEIVEPHPMTVEITPIGYHIHVDDEAFHVEWAGHSQFCGITQIVFLQNIIPLTRGELIYEEEGYSEEVTSFAEVEATLVDWFGSICLDFSPK